jgi:hypothetical protein
MCLGGRGRAGKLMWEVILFGGGQLGAWKWKPETCSLILVERDRDSKPVNFVVAKSNVCNVSRSSYKTSYIHTSAHPSPTSMRPSNNSQPLIHRPPHRPERPLSALRPILRDRKPSRASFDFNPATRTFAHDDTAVDKQCAFAAEFRLMAEPAQQSAEVRDAQVADVDGVGGGVVGCVV